MSTPADGSRSRRRAVAEPENKDAEVSKDVEVDSENGHEESSAPAPAAKRTVRRAATSSTDEEDAPVSRTATRRVASEDDESAAPEPAKPAPRAGPKKVGAPRAGLQSTPPSNAKRAPLQRFSPVEENSSRPKNVDPIANEIEIFSANTKGFVKSVKDKVKEAINADGGSAGDLFAAFRAVNNALTYINKFGHGAQSIHIAESEFIAIVLSSDLKFGTRFVKVDDKVTATDEEFVPTSLQGFMTDDNGEIDSAYVSREFITDLAYLILEHNADKVTKQGKTGAATRQHYSMHQNVRHLFKDLISARSGTKAAPVSLNEISVAALTKLLLECTKPLDQEAAERDSPSSFADIRKTVKSDSDVIDLVRNGAAKIEAQTKAAAKKAASAAAK